MFTRNVLIFILLILGQPCFAQLETNHWFLSQNHISVKKGGVTTGLPFGNSSFFSPQNTTASISDVNGNLLFVSDGYVVLDKNYNEMFDLDKMELYGRNAKVMIQQIPESEKYYLFYSTDNQSPKGNGNNSRTLKYALIDMSLNNGNGGVVTYDNTIDTVISEAFTIAAGRNASEFWLVTHRHSTDSFFVYPITSAGLGGTPVVSRAGTSDELLDYVFRDLKTSYDGKMIAGIAYRNYSASFAITHSFVEIFNFDAVSGKLHYRVRTKRRFNYFLTYLSLEFSADNRLLYEGLNTRAYGLQPCGFGSGTINQYNLCYQDSTEFTKYMVNTANKLAFCSPSLSWGNILMGADKRIYMPYTGTTVSTIDFPNRIGSYAGYEFNSLTLPLGNSGVIATPNFTHYLMEKSIKNNIVYDGGCYPAPMNFKITNDTITKVEWDFGDPASGTNTVISTNPSHVFSAPGFYTVTATLSNFNNQIIETVSELVEIKDPEVRLLHGLPLDTSFCFGNSLNLKLNVVNGLYRWYKLTDEGEEYDSRVSDAITIESSGKWYVELRQNDCNGCSMLDSINVTVLRKPYVNLGPDRNVCAGDSVRIEYYDDAKVLWSTGCTSPGIWVQESGSYWLEAEFDQNGCSVRDTVEITKRQAIHFSLPVDTTLCDGQKLLIEPGVINASYRWQDGSLQPEYLVSQPGLYWVEITSSFGCSKTDSIQVDYISAQQVNLGNDTVICTGHSVTMDAGVTNAQYLWSTNQKTRSIVVNQSGKYWVQVKNGNCVISDTINVQVSDPSTLWLGNDTTLCYGTSIVLSTGISGATSQWQDGSDKNSFVIKQSGTYWVEVKKDGCILRDSIKIDYHPESFIGVGSDRRFCQGDSAVIQATPGLFNYQWNTGAVESFIKVRQPGKYVVNAEDANGCLLKDSMNVLPFYLNPLIDLGPDKSLCSGEELILQAGKNFAGYEWSNGSTFNSLAVNKTGTYWVKVVDQNGCAGRDTMQILEIFPAPTRFLGNDTTICSYGKLDIIPERNFSDYVWSNGSNTRIVSVSQPGVYWLKVTDNNGCSGNDSISVKLKDCMKGLYVPNAFTPNNDGKNDILNAMIFGDIESFTFRIYNRFGQLIFSSNDPAKGWDGNSKGMPQEIGSYVWQCQYKFRNEPAKSEKGIFYLLR